MTDWQAEFLTYLTTERGYSGHTVSAYRSDLEKFKASLAETDLLNASPDDIRKFILGLLDAGLSPSSARRRLSTIKSFFRFVFGEGGLGDDPSVHIRAPRAFHPIIRPITRAEVDRIIDSLGKDRRIDIRNRALVYTAYGSGLRVSEIVNLRSEDVDFQSCVAKVRLGKGRKDRLVPLNHQEMIALRLYLDKARPHFAQKSGSAWLFVGRGGERLSRQRIWQILTKLSNRVVGRSISPHKYRHAFVTDTINGGAAARVVQKMAGHKSVNSTMGYMHCDLARTRAEYLKTHPRGVAL